MQWSGNFSSDADAGMSLLSLWFSVCFRGTDRMSRTGVVVWKVEVNRRIGVIEDAKFKRREALADLAKAVPTEGFKK